MHFLYVSHRIKRFKKKKNWAQPGMVVHTFNLMPALRRHRRRNDLWEFKAGLVFGSHLSKCWVGHFKDKCVMALWERQKNGAVRVLWREAELEMW